MISLNGLAYYLLGTVRISISGDYCERFLNVLAANSVTFNKIKKRKDNFELTLLKKDFFKLRELRKNTNVKIKIINKNGLPFLLRKYKFRYGMLTGFILFWTVLLFMSSRLWVIEINGNEIVSDNEVYSAVEKLGIKEGMSMNKIDTDILKLDFILSGENIAWSSFNKQGCVLQVNLTEFAKKDTDVEPCNLIAEYDAIIKKIDVQSGMLNVKIGDTVQKGQLLVSGIVSYGDFNRFVVSKGKILAEVSINLKEEISKNYRENILIKNTTNRYSIEIFGLNLPLYLGKLDGNYIITRKSDYLKLFGGKLPIVLHKKEYCKIQTIERQITENEAINIIKENIKNKYMPLDSNAIIYSEENIIDGQDKYIYTASIKFVKDITVKEKIIISAEK
ncbi:MAG: hypothetical protein E7568_05040 [Ruminococcaceae bacterium]|nr:hypothetical protein [Oscillospiraceae bacterium]